MQTKEQRLAQLQERRAAVLSTIAQYQKDIEQLSRNGINLEGQIELLETLISEEKESDGTADQG